MPTAAEVLRIAASQIGTVENPRGTNRVKYWAALRPSFQGQPWCGAFTSWVFARAVAIDLIRGPEYYCPTQVKKFQAMGRFGRTPRVGAVVLFTFGKREAVHVGIVEKILTGGRIQTIEGNTSSSNVGSQNNGGGVYRRIRSASSGVAGYGYPAYTAGRPSRSTVRKPVAKPFPLPAGHWFGLLSADPRNHSGYTTADRAAIKTIQAKVGVTADGDFGPNTRARVIRWQTAHNLTADGRVGARTWAALNR